MDKKTLAFYLDFANHHADALPQDIKKLCLQVKKFGFHSAFVNPCYVPLARKLLGDITVGTVVAFPLGQDSPESKLLAALGAVRQGADELDVSMNIGLFKAGKEDAVLEEMKTVVGGVKALRSNVVVKFIIETGFLASEEIKKASLLVLKSRADFVKTSSGWGPRGASLKDISLIRTAVGDKIKVKAAGGIDTFQEALAFIEASVDRIGTSKATAIIK